MIGGGTNPSRSQGQEPRDRRRSIRAKTLGPDGPRYTASQQRASVRNRTSRLSAQSRPGHSGFAGRRRNGNVTSDPGIGGAVAKWARPRDPARVPELSTILPLMSMCPVAGEVLDEGQRALGRRPRGR
jgi:hypothetical protein